MIKNVLPLTLLFALGMLASSSHAQDLAAKSMTRSTGSYVKSGTTQSISLVLDVVETIPVGNSFSISYAINGGTTKVAVQSAQFQGQVEPGTDINPVNVLVEFPKRVSDTDTVVVDIFVKLANDKNASNDTVSTEYYIVETADNDISVSIVSPDNNSEQKTWTTVQFTVKIKNEGLNPFPNGATMFTGLTVNNQRQGDPSPAIYNGTTLQPGDSTEFPVGLDLNRYAPAGTMNTCLYYIWSQPNGTPIDENVTDNLGCVALNVVINSINEQVLGLNSIYYGNNALNLELENKASTNQYKFDIVNITGQTITSSTANADFYLNHRIDMSGADHGMYIVNIYADDVYVGSEKFMVH